MGTEWRETSVSLSLPQMIHPSNMSHLSTVINDYTHDKKDEYGFLSEYGLLLEYGLLSLGTEHLQQTHCLTDCVPGCTTLSFSLFQRSAHFSVLQIWCRLLRWGGGATARVVREKHVTRLSIFSCLSQYHVTSYTSLTSVYRTVCTQTHLSLPGYSGYRFPNCLNTSPPTISTNKHSSISNNLPYNVLDV